MDPAGLYLHVPFCTRHCPFCDFAITTDLRLRERWQAAILRELELRAPDCQDLEFDTIYLGGGTPSTLAHESLAELLGRVRRALHLLPDVEITLEVNPGDLEEDRFRRLREVGVNRLSLGLQSFDPAHLELLGRDHTVEESRSTFEAARRAGFENISIDLIHGLPHQTLEHWDAQLGEALDLEPEHLSSYALTYEPGTPLTRDRDAGAIEELDDETCRELLIHAHHRLDRGGLEGYEVSNFARSPQTRSRHNQKYWNGNPYLGLGPGAHSFRDGVRTWNRRSTPAYLERLESGQSPGEDEEHLTPEQRRLELLFLGLRQRGGLELARFEALTGEALETTRSEELDSLRERGLARLESGWLRLTLEGLVVADSVVLELSD